jgi:hypothetical protein
MQLYHTIHNRNLTSHLPGPPVPDASTFIKAPIVSCHLCVFMNPCEPLSIKSSKVNNTVLAKIPIHLNFLITASSFLQDEALTTKSCYEVGSIIK